MIKNIIQFKEEIEGQEHTYMCEFNCPTPHVKDFAMALIHWAKQIEDNAAAEAAKAEPVPEPMPGVEVHQEPELEVLNNCLCEPEEEVS